MGSIGKMIRPQRLEGETFEQYRSRRAEANAAIKRFRRGRFIWEAIKVVTMELNAKGFPVMGGMVGEDGVVAYTSRFRRKVQGTYDKAKHGPIGTPRYKAA
jgi:hypothetical protein